MNSSRLHPRIIFAHCWGGNPYTHAFYADSRAQLERAGFAVDIPAMPDTDAPRLRPWTATLEGALTPQFAGERRIVVAHSLGTITTMRCIEQGSSVDGMIIVAGNTSDVGFPDELGEFFENGVDYDAVRRGLSMPPELFYSDDDPYVPVEEGLALARELKGSITLMQGMGHFSGPNGEPGSCEKLPEVVHTVHRMAQSILP